MPEDESFASPCNLISSLERPRCDSRSYVVSVGKHFLILLWSCSFDLLDYINWCKFLDWDMKAVKQLTDENSAE
jgi:hypothetical protein